MNHDNRSKSARTSKIAQKIIAHLKAQGVEIKPDQEIAALNEVEAEKNNVARLDRDAVMAVADELGLDVGVKIIGKYSMELNFPNPFGETRYISVGCAGEKYWIEVAGGKETEKWCMPRDEVSGDRADKFLIEALRTYQSGDCSNLQTAVALCLGIGGLASIGYTKDILAKKRLGKNA